MCFNKPSYCAKNLQKHEISIKLRCARTRKTFRTSFKLIMRFIESSILLDITLIKLLRSGQNNGAFRIGGFSAQPVEWRISNIYLRQIYRFTFPTWRKQNNRSPCLSTRRCCGEGSESYYCATSARWGSVFASVLSGNTRSYVNPYVATPQVFYLAKFAVSAPGSRGGRGIRGVPAFRA